MNSNSDPNPPTKELSPTGRIFYGVISISLYCLAFYFLIYPNFSKSLQSLQWESTDGKIENVIMLYYWGDMLMKEDQVENRNIDDEWSFVVIVEYSYKVNDQLLQNDMIRYKLGFAQERDALYRGESLNKALYYKKKYEKKTELRVYFNPENPEQSVLKPGPSIMDWFINIMLFLIVPFIGLLVMISGFKKMFRGK